MMFEAFRNRNCKGQQTTQSIFSCSTSLEKGILWKLCERRVKPMWKIFTHMRSVWNESFTHLVCVKLVWKNKSPYSKIVTHFQMSEIFSLCENNIKTWSISFLLFLVCEKPGHLKIPFLAACENCIKNQVIIQDVKIVWKNSSLK